MRLRTALVCAACVLAPAGLAWSATTQTTPLQTPTATHTASKHKHVPVVAPKHAGPPRRAAAPVKTQAHKPTHAPAHAAHPGTATPKLAEPAPAPVAKPPPKPAAPALPADVGSNTGLHLPRYASLKSDEVNMRVGPAERYPVVWTYKRRELPVRILREFDIWRLVEDMDGIKGWMIQATLTGRRTFVITGTADETLRASANDQADAVAVLKPGVVGRIKACAAAQDWCQVQVAGYTGWLQRATFWGTDAGEAVTP